MTIELIAGAIKAILMIVLGLNLSLFLLYFERKGSALIQDRIGSNRVTITGIGKRMGMPNLGIINTTIADPVKMFTKEDFVPDGADKFLHTLAPFLALFPVMITFVVIPFGDEISIAGHRIGLEAANLNAGALYLLATIGLGVYGVALAGWSSNNRWALLGGIRATAQMISYELAMGLAIVSVIMTFGTLNLQEIVRGQGGVWFGFLPRWGIFVQPLAFILLLVAGAAESKRIPFDLPESESELIQGYFTEYSGGKQAVFMLTDFAEQALIAMLLTTFFLGGWQSAVADARRLSFAGRRISRGARAGRVDPGGDRVPGESRGAVHLPRHGAMDAAALPLRSVDAARMEGTGAARTVQRAADRIRRGGDRESPVMPPFLYIFLGALAIVSALGVIVQRNPIHSLLALIGTLMTVAILFIGENAVVVGFPADHRLCGRDHGSVPVRDLAVESSSRNRSDGPSGAEIFRLARRRRCWWPNCFSILAQPHLQVKFTHSRRATARSRASPASCSLTTWSRSR